MQLLHLQDANTIAVINVNAFMGVPVEVPGLANGRQTGMNATYNILTFERPAPLSPLVRALHDDDKSVTCVAVAIDTIVIGCHDGTLAIYDHRGNEVKVWASLHSARLTCLSISQRSQFLASGASDGSVAFINLADEFDITMLRFDFPVTAVALELGIEAAYKESRSLVLAVGGENGELLVTRQGWLKSQESILVFSDPDGLAVEFLSWWYPLVAFSNKDGVGIYNVQDRTRVGRIGLSLPARPGWTEATKLSTAFWESAQIITLVAADSLLRVRLSLGGSGSSHPDKKIDGSDKLLGTVDQVIRFGCPVQSVVEYGPSAYLVLLESCSLHVVCRSSGKCLVSWPGSPDARLIKLPSQLLALAPVEATGYMKAMGQAVPTVFCVGPGGLLRVRPRSVLEQVSWSLLHESIDLTMRILQDYPDSASLLPSETKLLVYVKYVQFLLASGQTSAAVRFCGVLRTTNNSLWSQVLDAFESCDSLDAVALALPRNLKLPSHYNRVMVQCIRKDPELLRRLIVDWAAGQAGEGPCYEVAVVADALRLHLKTCSGLRVLPASLDIPDRRLLIALIELVAVGGDAAVAAEMCLELDPQDALSKQLLFADLLKRDAVVAVVRKNISKIVAIDVRQAVTCLVSLAVSCPPELVLGHMVSGFDQCMYLHELWQKNLDSYNDDQFQHLHDRQAVLYLHHDRPKMLPFLSYSQHLSIDELLSLCEADEKLFAKELVFVLSRLGDHKRCVSVLIEHCCDVEAAMAVAVRHDVSGELWRFLIDLVLSSAAWLSDFLDHVGPFVDPQLYIPRLPLGVQVPGLREKIHRILSLHQVQVNHFYGALRRVNKSDCSRMLASSHASRAAALRVDPVNICAICGTKAWPASSKALLRTEQQGALVFACRHVIHRACLLRHNSERVQPVSRAVDDEETKELFESLRKERISQATCCVCYDTA